MACTYHTIMQEQPVESTGASVPYHYLCGSVRCVWFWFATILVLAAGVVVSPVTQLFQARAGCAISSFPGGTLSMNKLSGENCRTSRGGDYVEKWEIGYCDAVPGMG